MEQKVKYKKSGMVKAFCGRAYDADLSARGKKEEGYGRVLSKYKRAVSPYGRRAVC